MTRFALVLRLALALGGAGAFACGAGDPAHEGEGAAERGPHGGRWLEDGAFALELAIFEEGAAPELRAWVYRDEQPIDPSRVALTVTLRRLGDRVEAIGFAPRGAFLAGDRTVDEPHSFDVEIVAREAGREHRFAFSQYESRVTLEPDQLAAAGIAVAVAGPATIREGVVLNGRVAPNGDALAHVTPRFPGVVRSVEGRLGAEVARGERLATIESNESLQPFELRAPLAGRVVAKSVAPGEFVSPERELFQIVDLSSVWVDLDVYRRDAGRLRAGQRVRVDAGDGSPPAESALAYLAPVGSVETQTLLARVVLANPEGRWRPGLFVSARVEVGAAEVPVAVTEAALQRLRDRDVVFVAAGESFEAQPVELGRRDGTHVEIVSGLSAGQRYAAAGSFLLKAEAGKSGAAHDH